MRWKFFFKNLCKSLLSNKRQTILTLGSLFIGVVSVLLVLGLGDGVNKSLKKQMSDITGGDNSFIVNYLPQNGSGSFTINDQKRLESFNNINKVQLTSNDSLRTVSISVTGLNISQEEVSYGKLTKNRIHDSTISNLYGEKLSQMLANSSSSIALKSSLAKELSKNPSSLIGQIISVGGKPYKISSIYTGVEETPDLLLVEPIFLAVNNYNLEWNQLKIRYRGHKSAAENKVLQYLKQFGDAANYGSYKIEDLSQVVSQIQRTTSLATHLIAGVAGISLIVAGFGVMSSTYSSIANRQNEIGLRRAFGATKVNIRNQFIMEGLILAVLSSITSLAFVLFLSQFFGGDSGVQLVITAGDVVISILIPTVICFIFTYFPAVAASRKNVLELLR